MKSLGSTGAGRIPRPYASGGDDNRDPLKSERLKVSFVEGKDRICPSRLSAGEDHGIIDAPTGDAAIGCIVEEAAVRVRREGDHLHRAAREVRF